MEDYRIIGVTTVGTYNCWGAWTVGSFYNSVDDVVIINGGYIPEKPELGNCNILEREKQQFKDMDVDNKIYQFKCNNDNLKKTGLYKEGKDELARSGNMTLSYQYAYKLAQDKGYDLSKVWILKLDADQICNLSFTRENLLKLAKSGEHNGYRFAQYADFFRSYERVQSLPDWCANEVGNFTNDGSLFFRTHAQAHAGGQGSPGVGEEYPCTDFATYHMRRIHPPDMDEYKYHFDKIWYHTWGPNQIMEYGFNREHGRKMTNEEVWEEAERVTKGILETEGTHISEYGDDIRIAKNPPKIVEIGIDEYIKEGYPK